jgi:hypothetical protein
VDDVGAITAFHKELCAQIFGLVGEEPTVRKQDDGR